MPSGAGDEKTLAIGKGDDMDSELAACILQSQAKDAIRSLAGFAADDEEIRVAADLTCGQGRFSGLDGEALAEEIIASRRRALREALAAARQADAAIQA